MPLLTKYPLSSSPAGVCFAVVQIIVPTTDGVRNTFLLDLLIRGEKHVLTCGPTGTGKTVNIAQYLMGQSFVGGRCAWKNLQLND